MMSPRITPRAFVGLVVLGLLGLPKAAWAGYDPYCDVDVEDYPADGAVEVERNTLLMYGSIASDSPFWGSPPEIHVQDASGIVSNLWLLPDIPGWEEDCNFVFKASGPLSPLTEYTVREGDGLGPILATFTTGIEEDNSAPELSIVTPPGPWPSIIAYTGSDDIVAITATYSQGITVTFVAHTPPVDGELALDWLPARLNNNTDVTLTAYDRAGNSTEVTLRGYDDGGCSTAGGRLPGLWFGLLLLALTWSLLRRRYEPR